MSEQQIMQELRAKGTRERDIPQVMRDVGTLIIGRTMALILAPLPEAERAHLSESAPTVVEAYFKEHPELLAGMTQERFDTIHDDTWREYFEAAA